jgi:hypothetical protein
MDFTLFQNQCISLMTRCQNRMVSRERLNLDLFQEEKDQVGFRESAAVRPVLENPGNLNSLDTLENSCFLVLNSIQEFSDLVGEKIDHGLLVFLQRLVNIQANSSNPESDMRRVINEQFNNLDQRNLTRWIDDYITNVGMMDSSLSELDHAYEKHYLKRFQGTEAGYQLETLLPALHAFSGQIENLFLYNQGGDNTNLKLFAIPSQDTLPQLRDFSELVKAIFGYQMDLPDPQRLETPRTSDGANTRYQIVFDLPFQVNRDLIDTKARQEYLAALEDMSAIVTKEPLGRTRLN